MTGDEEIKLAKYLRELERKLADEEEQWINWVRGSLTGIAQMLEIKNSFSNDEDDD